MATGDVLITREELRKKNLRVVAALGCGVLLPFLHIAFLARFLPDWLNAALVGGVFWICFAEVIPANTVGILRRPKVSPAATATAKTDSHQHQEH
jgi:hypothetical protein